MDPQPEKKDEDEDSPNKHRPPISEADNEDSSPGNPSDRPVTPLKRRRPSEKKVPSSTDEETNNPQPGPSSARKNLEASTMAKRAPPHFLNFDPDDDETNTDFTDILTSDSDTFATNHQYGDHYRVQGLIYGVRGAQNTCVLDPFLTTLKLWTYRSKYDFMRNFRSKTGPGRELEDHLRKMMDRILINSLLITDMESALSDTADMHNIWVCILTGEMPTKPVDLLGSPDRLLYDKINSISSFYYLYRCRCKKNFEIKEKSRIHFTSQEQVTKFIMRQFVPDRSITSDTSTDCGHELKCRVLVPSTTWIMVFTFGLGMRKDPLPTALNFEDDILFRLAFTTYNRSFRKALPAPKAIEIVNLEDEVDEVEIVTLEDEVEIVNLAEENSEKGRKKEKKGPKADQDKSKKTFTSLDQNTVADGHMTSRIMMKNSWFRYDDQRDNGRLTFVENRHPPMDQQNRLESTIFFRNPPRRRSHRSILHQTAEAEDREKQSKVQGAQSDFEKGRG